MSRLYDQRSASERRDRMTRRRLDEIVPRLMAEHKVDCWILTSREYTDDPVVMTMLPSSWLTSRRRTILVFLANDEEVERLAVARYDTDGMFEISWDPDEEPDQFRALARIVAARDPRKIAVNMSGDFAHADGLSASEREHLIAALGPDLASRVIPADALAVNWLETRLSEERPAMTAACSAAHGLLRRALSPEAIIPGTTTTDDVVWWLRDRVQEMGTTIWFTPTVSVQRRSGDLRGSFAERPGTITIEPGDLVHIDFGIVWDGLCTDQQQHGYVLAESESEVPAWLNEALGTGNAMQDIVTGAFRLEATGNQVLASALSEARAEGLRAKVYTHPLGFHGHGAGPTIGLWDRQDGVPGSGERFLRADTAWSIELMVEVESQGWDGQTVRIMVEEDAWFDGEAVEFLDGRQTSVWPI